MGEQRCREHEPKRGVETRPRAQKKWDVERREKNEMGSERNGMDRAMGWKGKGGKRERVL